LKEALAKRFVLAELKINLGVAYASINNKKGVIDQLSKAK
jgi:hypothetical protein